MQALLIAHTSVFQNIPGYTDHVDPTTAADDLCEQAGRLCYLSWERPNPATATNEGYLANILKQGHHSVLEHANVTIYIEDVTRNLTHEFERHRHFSYSELSQRYVPAGKLKFVTHPGLRGVSSETQKKIIDSVQVGRDTYQTIIEDLESQGIEGKQARQAARHVLASGTETRCLVTGNLRAWRDMLYKRLAPAADAEFRELAQKLLAIMRMVAPNSFQDFPAIP